MQKSRKESVALITITTMVFIPIMLFWYAALGYLQNKHEQDFKNKVSIVTDSLKKISSRITVNATSLQSLTSVLDKVEPEKFSKVVDGIVFNEPYISSITYYKLVEHSERSLLEGSYPDGFLATSSSEGVERQVEKDRYLISHAADKNQTEAIYMGWDLFSDQRQKNDAYNALESRDIVVSSPYLLDEGDSALDVLIPVKGGNQKVKGLINLTLNITLFLSSKESRADILTKVYVPLKKGGELKKVLTSNLLKNDLKDAITIFSVNEPLELFGNKLKFTFEKGLSFSELNKIILATVFFIGIIILALSFYLTNTLQNLKNTLIKIEKINSSLEETVALRTKNLQMANMEIKEILDNLDDAIMVIDNSYNIPKMHSPASSNVLGIKDLTGRSIFDTLFKDLSKSKEEESRHLFSFRNLLGCDEFQWTITNDDYLRQISYTCPSGQGKKTFSLRYSPFIENGKVERLLIVASDITVHLKLREDFEKQQKESGAKTEAISEMLKTSKKGLSTFMEETDNRMQVIADLLDKNAPDIKKEIWAGIFRELHTLKGNSRFYKLSGFSGAVHILEEDCIGLLDGEKEDKKLQEVFFTMWQSLKERYSIYKELYRDLFTSKGENSLEIAPIISLLESNKEKKEIASILKAQHGGKIFNLTELFSSFNDMAAEVAHNLDKKVTLAAPKEDLWLDNSLFSILKDCFTHAIRNGLDHGLEGEKERVEKNKNESGTIWLETKALNDKIILKLRDDGRGIHVEKVKSIAIEKGLIEKDAKLEDNQIIELLFHSGFSTKEAASDVSGRGVGLDAVRHSLKEQGCLVHLESEFGKGSATCITIPLSKVFKTLDKAG